MAISQFHFAHPFWLLAGLCVPLLWLVFFLSPSSSKKHQLEKFVDSHLLPYLLINKGREKKRWKGLLFWSLCWISLTLALAGPRWNFREIELFSKDHSLVILLDLSNSMNATDLKPSRLIRAKQKIEDLLNHSKGIKIGLVAFAADPHMITPLTDDKKIVKDLFSALTTDIIAVQGSRLSSALTMASGMLEAERGDQKSILLMTDGGFEDASAISIVKSLADKGIATHVFGFGTQEGVPLNDSQGNIHKKNGVPIFSKLESQKLKEVSRTGKGIYLEGDQLRHAEAALLEDLDHRSQERIATGKKIELWDEAFYLFLLPVLPFLLWCFRRGTIFTALLFFPFFAMDAHPIEDYFLNSEERGKRAFEEGNYEAAQKEFQDAYRRGVASYKAGNFSEAEELFKQSDREEVAVDAAYNLGNALAKQNKLKEAVIAYEKVLATAPSHALAKENLDLIKKLLEHENHQKSEDSKDSQQKQNEEKKQEKDSKDSRDTSDSSKDEEEKGKEEGEQNPPEESSEKESEDSEGKGQDHQRQDGEEESAQDKQEREGNDEKREEDEKESLKEAPAAPDEKDEEQKPEPAKTEEEQNADFWLNRIHNDPKTFMKNKFFIESKKNKTTEGTDPW